MQYEKEAHRRPENAKIFDKRLPEFQYTVRKLERTYLAVSPQAFLKVKSYAGKKSLSMVEATWRLLSIGMQYNLGGDPRDDPRFEATMEITRQIESHLEKKYGVPIEKYLEAAGQTDLEDRVINILQYQSMRTKPRRAYPGRKGLDSAINVLNVMETTYMTMLLGAQKIIDELENKVEASESKLEQIDKQQKQSTSKFKDKSSIVDSGNEDN